MPPLIYIPVVRKSKVRKGDSTEVQTAGMPVFKTHFKVHAPFYKTEAAYRHSWWPYSDYSGKRDRYEKLPEK
ncbi:hypothetical protein [Chitinophaga ginsengisoli]|uniref:Uncharacterized protein n=1 Tax=Chitinophaga ginsengisoli TaxID=363837 RepID=A0A2P8GD91_9BACT|nr:hypothetical protein [Chitinophaga ginsengisoli]PSL31938.1 hypothetical protein CLV42_104239 [Chitinophaga ginsengisoli]